MTVLMRSDRWGGDGGRSDDLPLLRGVKEHCLAGFEDHNVSLSPVHFKLVSSSSDIGDTTEIKPCFTIADSAQHHESHFRAEFRLTV
jgi:hypothetical protein